jgi:hypothetical protein
MRNFLFKLVVIFVFGISLVTFSGSVTAGRKVIGKWQDSSGVLGGAVYEIYIDGGKIYLSSKYSDGSGGIDQLEKIGNRYREIGNELEWFVINSRGYLEIYDTMGLITKMVPIK